VANHTEASATRPGGPALVRAALGRRANWTQLLKFCLVGASGYVVNLGIFAGLIAADLHYLPAAVCSFVVAVTNNYWWNRHWTFRNRRGHLVYQGMRFLVVSVVALGVNLAALSVLVELGLPKLPAQAIAIALVTPWNFVVNKLWSFGR
jgi:putative flippase GtrA